VRNLEAGRQTHIVAWKAKKKKRTNITTLFENRTGLPLKKEQFTSKI
jgi:hypothetical protein